MTTLMLFALGAAELGLPLEPHGDQPIHYHVGWVVTEVQDNHDIVDIDPGDSIIADFWIDPAAASPSHQVPTLGSATYQPLVDAESRIQVGDDVDIWTSSYYDVHKLQLFNAQSWSNTSDRLTFGTSNASDPLNDVFSHVSWSVELRGDLIDGIGIPQAWQDNVTFGRIELMAKTEGHHFRVIGAPVPEPTTLCALLPCAIWFMRRRGSDRHRA